MITIFLDSSVIVAACGSITGASAYILGAAKQGDLTAYVTLDVIGEARHNVLLKMPITAKQRLITYLKYAKLHQAPIPSLENIVACEQYIHEKDASILAAAKALGVDYLISLDQKHFLTVAVKRYMQPSQVMTSRDFVVNILKHQR